MSGKTCNHIIYVLILAFVTVSCCLVATRAHATPKQGVDYTYETIKYSHDIIRHPDEVLIPPDQANEDYIAYKHWRLMHPFVSDYQPTKPTKKEK